MKFNILFSAAALSVALMSSAAYADTIVTPSNPQGWSNPPGENGNGTGHSEITNTAPRSGTGSLELYGDRTRFILGNQYNEASNLMPLSELTGVKMDWMIDGDSVSPLGPDLTPALRVHIWDNGVRTELIWEGAYNGVYGPQTVPNTWYTTGYNDKFYRGSGNENAGVSIASWVSQYSSNAYVSAFSIGTGSSAGAGHHTFADNFTVRTASGESITNFEVAAVPEPGTWALMIIGFGGTGAMLRTRRKTLALAA